MIPLIIISPEEYFKVPNIFLRFMYPIICSLQPLCEDGPPTTVKANVDFLTAIKSIECNCGEEKCRLTVAREASYDFVSRHLGTRLVTIQASEIVNEEAVFAIAGCVNGDADNGIPPMSITDATYIYTQAQQFKHESILSRSAGEVPVPPVKKPRNRKKQ